MLILCRAVWEKTALQTVGKRYYASGTKHYAYRKGSRFKHVWKSYLKYLESTP